MSEANRTETMGGGEEFNLDQEVAAWRSKRLRRAASTIGKIQVVRISRRVGALHARTEQGANGVAVKAKWRPRQMDKPALAVS
ncbi:MULTISPECIES: hypothetical protein [Bradyrhizobium]|uniref:hypothetical protein n=1 Tax=Bradyrhizobium TaxID=374 RepID=UPI000480D03F|nr:MULTISPECIES: hypothetical protein [Bradyrhizobium]QOG16370.1 hypothetical protein FOM02_02490 [Bradyrhizobium sp. SEMIA]UFW49047.1 hypothetical protein BaraCB756_43645 [Bradyrhizobium arachidis]